MRILTSPALSLSRVLLQHSTDTRTALALPDLSPWKPKHFDLPRPATADLLHVRHFVLDTPVKEHLMVVLLYCTFPYTSSHRTTLHRPPSTDLATIFILSAWRPAACARRSKRPGTRRPTSRSAGRSSSSTRLVATPGTPPWSLFGRSVPAASSCSSSLSPRAPPPYPRSPSGRPVPTLAGHRWQPRPPPGLPEPPQPARGPPARHAHGREGCPTGTPATSQHAATGASNS